MSERAPALRLRTRGATVAAALLVLVGVVAGSGACSALRAGRLLDDALQPPPEPAAGLVRADIVLPTRAGRVTVRTVRPATDDGPWPAIVLVHGAVDAGARERRFAAFADAFAARGMAVAAPDLRSLATFRMDRDDPVRVADVARWLAHDSGWAEDGDVALAGVSVGGSFALVAAGDGALRADVSAVLAFGAYADLDALLLRWLTGPTQEHGELFDPLREGRRLVLLGNVDHLVEPAERDEVASRIRAILDGQPVAADGLSPAAAEVVAVAAGSDPLAPERARALLDRLGETLGRLSPARGAPPAAPVYLLHGSRDPVVPVEDIASLATALRARGVPVDTHVTDLFDHVDAETRPGLLEAWPLLRFLGAFLDDAGL